MTRALTLTTAVLACALPLLSPLPAHADEESLQFRRAESAFRGKRRGEALKLYRKFLDTYPNTNHLERATYNLVECLPKTPEGKAEGVRRLRIVAANHGIDSPTNTLLWNSLAKVTGWRFSSVPERVDAKAKALDLGRRGRRPRQVRRQLYHVSGDAVLAQAKQILGAEGDPSGLIDPLPTEDRWTLISETLDAEGGATVALPPEHGRFVLAESIDGFRRYHHFERRSFHLLVRGAGNSLGVYALESGTGEPVAGIRVVTRVGEREIERKTDASGVVRFAVGAGAKGLVLGSRGKELQVVGFALNASPKAERRVFVSTDRSVYRPGQTVQFKAVLRSLDGAAILNPIQASTRVEVRGPQGRILQPQDLSWNAAGTLSGSFTLNAEPRLGTYAILVHVPLRPSEDENDWSDFYPAWAGEWEGDPPKVWSRSFQVAAYRKPDAKVTIWQPAPEPDGAHATSTVEAEYFFGGPVVDADVEWVVYEETRTPWWRQPGSAPPKFVPDPPFEDPLAWLYKPLVDPDNTSQDYWEDWSWDEETVAEGDGVTGPDGRLQLRFPIVQDGRERRYRIEVSVSDESRFESDLSETFPLGGAGVIVECGAPRMFYVPGDKAEARVRVRLPNGEPVAGRAVQFSALLERGSRATQLEFESIWRGVATTDDSGLARFAFPVGSEGGRLRLKAQAKDSSGRTAVDRSDLWIAGSEALPLRNDTEETLGSAAGLSVEVLPDRMAYEIGETARLLVRSNQLPRTVVLSVEGGELHKLEPIRLTQPCTLIEVPLTAAHAPNVFVKLIAWRGMEVCADGVRLCVAPADRLDVRVETQRTTYGPRDKTQITIRTARRGRPVPAEVEVAVVDAKLFQLVPDATPNLVRFFHRLLPDSGFLSGGCFVDDGFRDLLNPDAGIAGGVFCFDDEEEDSGGIGLDAAEALSPVETRRWFPDTLLYRAQVETGPDGVVVVPLEMPDSLTRWRVLVRAVSGSDGFGHAQRELRTDQDVILRVSAPRFLVEGDEAVIAGVLHNDLKRAETFDLSFVASGAAELMGKTSQRVNVRAGGRAKVEFRVRAKGAGLATVRAEARSRGGSDAMELTIPVQAYGATGQNSIAVVTSGGNWKGSVELPPTANPKSALLDLLVDKGELTAIRSALPFLARYPYGCVEQTMSRFLPAVVAMDSMRRLGIRNQQLEDDLPAMTSAGLQRLYGFQHEDGGWGWWKYDETDPGMTTYVVYGLLRAREAGIPVDPTTLERGVLSLRELDEARPYQLYVRTLVTRLAPPDLREDSELASLLKAAEPGDEDTEVIDVAYLVLAGRRDLAKFLPADPDSLTVGRRTWRDVQEVALVLRALTSLTRQATDEAPAPSPLATAYKMRLLTMRQGTTWYSTLDTAHALLALSELARGEQGPSPTVRVNGVLALPDPSEPGRYRLDAKTLRAGKNTIAVEAPRDARFFVSAAMNYVTQDLSQAHGEALEVRRWIERARRDEDGERVWERLPIGATVRVKDELKVVVTVEAEEDAEFVMIESPLPAGAEGHPAEENEDWWEDSWYQRRELRDDRVSVAAREIDAEDEVRAEYYLRLTSPGVYRILPTRAFDMYDTHVQGRSAVLKLVIRE